MPNVIRTYRHHVATLHAIACVGLVVGCSEPILSLDDVVAVDGHESLLVAHLEHEPLHGMRVSIERATISFLYDGQPLAEQLTDDEGRAVAVCSLPGGEVSAIEATASVNGSVHRATSRLFRWPADRTVLVVDVDDTISETDYDDLLLDKIDRESYPLPHAQEAMNALAKDYGIIYLTGRPRFLLGKTREWLERKGFPPGPVITSPGLSEMLDFLSLKIDLIRTTKKYVPGLLIGLGDKRSDAEAYGRTGLLPLILRFPDKLRAPIRDKGIVFNDWPAVTRFFRDNRTVLSDPKRLAAALERGDFASFKRTSPTEPAKPSRQ